MKRIITSAALCGILVLATTVSCQIKMESPNPNKPGDSMEEYESRSLSIVFDGTRINSAGTSMRWNTGSENMAVIGKVGGTPRIYKFTKSGDQGSTPVAGNFTCDAVDVGAELLYAVFPYSESYSLTDDTTLSLNLSEAQNLNIMGSVSNNVLLAGKISAGTVTMKNVCAFLKFLLPQRLIDSGTSLCDVSHVNISGTGICGDVEVDFSGVAPSVTGAGDGDAIVAKPKIKSERGQAGTLYIPVLPGTYPSISFTIVYTAADGHSSFVKTTTNSNTLLRNEVYDCGTLSGPFAESLTCTSSLSGTTLTMEAESVLWKYSGVTNSDYTLQFRYKDSEDADIPANWTTVDAATVSGDGTDVDFSATATVTAGKTYDVVALAAADGVTKEATAPGAAAKVSVTLETSVDSDFSSIVYEAAPADGYLKVTDNSGNDIFPRFYPGAAADTDSKRFYKKVWSESSSTWGAVQTVTSGTPGKVTACKVTKDGFDFTFGPTGAYYSIYAKKLCAQSGVPICIHCPSGYTITKITIGAAQGTKLNWGLGSSSSSADIVAAVDYRNDSAAASHDFVIASPAEGTSYWLISGTSSNRLETLTVYYDY